MIDILMKEYLELLVRREIILYEYLRMLKKIGVEVYFTEDDIWTFNHEDRI